MTMEKYEIFYNKEMAENVIDDVAKQTAAAAGSIAYMILNKEGREYFDERIPELSEYTNFVGEKLIEKVRESIAEASEFAKQSVIRETGI